MKWTLQPGDAVKRTTLHEQYGGSGQGGINPANDSDTIMIFTDPEIGEEHGYLDRWAEGVLLYTGAGQRGDQTLGGVNGSILNHEEAGRDLHVFRGTHGTVAYDGQYALDPHKPYAFGRAPESGNPDVLRKVVMFRLIPLATATPPTEAAPNRQAIRGRN
jgi:hypothetical protein